MTLVGRDPRGAVTDGSWFEQFYVDSHSRLVVIALGFTRDLGDAEEVVQEALVRPYDRRARLIGVHSPEAWVCTVAMNIARRRHRRRVMADRPQSPSEDTAYLVRDDATTATTRPPAPGGIRWTGT